MIERRAASVSHHGRRSKSWSGAPVNPAAAERMNEWMTTYLGVARGDRPEEESQFSSLGPLACSIMSDFDHVWFCAFGSPSAKTSRVASSPTAERTRSWSNLPTACAVITSRYAVRKRHGSRTPRA